jgi:pyruvate dehydrogenase E2 component (dihydrolipoamide acetyltransferase)
VTGSGPAGRVGEEDVTRAAAATAADPEGASRSIPMTGMRATIAARMHASLHSAAQLTLVTEVDVTDLVAYREGLEDPRPSYSDVIIKAAALALRQHPRLNATLEGDRIRPLSEIHIGLATALDEGLIVPVVRDAERKTLRQIAHETAALVRRVRAGDFRAVEVSGSTFTVTSLGGLGVDAFTPIINPPEAAILGVGRVIDRPARDGDSLVWRKAITLSLTIDHRIVDGAPAAAFLQAVGGLLQSPQALEA